VGRRRETRGTRRRDRAIARDAAAPVRQDIFEVGNEGLPVEELANKLAVPPGEVVKILFMKGIMVQVNQVLDRDTVHMVVDEFEDVEIVDREAAALEDWARKTTDFVDEEDLDFLLPRPPVVTIMGHVDHGKTSLLDFVRKTKVAAGEAGGITQAIGAYTVQVPHDGENAAITFLDTPGHEAFSAMRARGTKVTDVAVIVVAADDGVRPQTQEAISHAKAAGVPIIIGLNKIDKEGAQPERVKQELADLGLLPEEWGGQTAMVPISAKFGQGVDDLLETILLQAEVEELSANPDRAARGTVIEAHLDRRRGPVASLLVQAGTLRIGDMVVASASYGKVKSLTESTGDVDSATPSLAVQMVGLNSVPTAGDEFYVCEDETMARKAAELAEDTQRLERLAASAGGGNIVTTKSWASMDDDSESLQRLNVILKADASGTVEAVKAALGALPQDSVLLRFLLAAPNQITTSDVDLAAASEAVILGFNAEPSEEVAAFAKEKSVTLRSYNVIYDLVDDVRAAMEGRLNTIEERTEIGQAEVRATFGSGNRIVAGCMVNEGVLRKGCFLVVKRGKKVVFEGPLTSLRRVKDDVKEVSHGLECGIRVDGFTGWREGDAVTAFAVAEKRRTLEEAAEASASMDAAHAASFSLDEEE
jgi:translation initiation factor IF-2